MTCLPRALSHLNPSVSPLEVLRRFQKLRPDGWTDLDLVYVGYTFDMIFTPFMSRFLPEHDFGVLYDRFDGICVGLTEYNKREPHAIAKTRRGLIDSDGGIFKGQLTETIFFAWMNQSRIS